MKLYYAPGRSSLAPHIVLREADRHFDLERVDLDTKRTVSGRDFLEINPNGYVPVLELDGSGRDTLTETQVILQYVGDLDAFAHLMAPSGTFVRYHVQEWLAFISTELHVQLCPLFSRSIQPAFAAEQRARVGERLSYLQNVLSDRGFLMGARFTVADAYLFVMLQWCDQFGIDLHLWPNLDDYETRISQRTSVEAALDAEGVHGRHRRHRRSA